MNKPILTPIQLEIREKFIYEANKKGLSLQEIADLFQPISKPRVHQIIIAYRSKNRITN